MTNMVLLFNTKSDAHSAAQKINEKAGLPSSSGNTTDAVSIIENDNNDKWAIDVYQYDDREWISDIKELADEVVSELSKDWFGEEI
jgi:hypothetical protein